MSSIPLAFTFINETISVVQHALQIARALKDVRDSPEDYQQLSSELNALKETLGVAKDMWNKKTLLSSVQEAFLYSLSMCGRLLDEFKAKNIGFEHHLGQNKAGYGFRSIPRRIGWVIFRKDDVDSLRRKLHDQQTHMAIILCLNTTNVLGEFRKSLDVAHEERRELAGELHELAGELRELAGMGKRISRDQQELRDLVWRFRIEHWDMCRSLRDLLRTQQGSTSHDSGRWNRIDAPGLQSPASPCPTDHGIQQTPMAVGGQLISGEIQPCQTRHDTVCSGSHLYPFFNCALEYGKEHPQYTPSPTGERVSFMRIDWLLM